MTNDEKCLREILGVFLKYEPSVFLRIIEDLEKSRSFGDFTRLARIVEECIREKSSSGLVREAGRGYSKRPPRDRLFEIIAEIQKTESNNILSQFIKDLYERRVLDKNSDFRQFFSVFGVQIGDSRKLDRTSTILRIARTMKGMSSVEISKLIDMGKQIDRSHSDLEGWSKIIVKDE